MKSVIIFEIEDQKYALPCSIVSKIINSVLITPLPHTPKKILGIINIHGDIVPILNIRHIMELPPKDIRLTDKIIVIKTETRLIAFIADTVEELAEIDDDKYVNMDEIIPNPDIYDGTIKLDYGLIMIYNAEKFLTLNEEEILDNVLTNTPLT